MVAGKLELRTSLDDYHTENTGTTIGTVSAGETLGEEGIYESGPAHRRDSAYAVEDSFVMEFSKDIIMKAKDMIQQEGFGMDWFTLNNQIKK